MENIQKWPLNDLSFDENWIKGYLRNVRVPSTLLPYIFQLSSFMRVAGKEPIYESKKSSDSNPCLKIPNIQT